MLDAIRKLQEGLWHQVKEDSRSSVKLDAAGRLAGIDMALGAPEKRRQEIAEYFKTAFGYSLEQIEAEAEMLNQKQQKEEINE